MTAPETPDQESTSLVAENIHSAPADVLRGAFLDLKESDHKLRLVFSTAVGIGTAVVNAAKIPLVTAPAVALEALQYTNNPLVSGLVSGAVFGGWTWAASGVINEAGSHYPEAKERAKRRYPKTTEFLIESLPGLHQSEDSPGQAQSALARLGSSALVHTKRGTAVVGVGTSFYIVAAQLEEMPKKEVSRLRRLAAGDGAVFIGSMSIAAAGLVAKIGDSHPELADRIHDGSTDTKTLLALAATLIVGQGVGKLRSKRRTSKNHHHVQLPHFTNPATTLETE